MRYALVIEPAMSTWCEPPISSRLSWRAHMSDPSADRCAGRRHSVATGQITRIVHDRSYGFIQPVAGAEEILFYHSTMEDDA